jgi:ribonucleoside-diphosphate reductase alpha chain
MEITKKIVSAVLVEDSAANKAKEPIQSVPEQKIKYTERTDIVNGYTIKIKYKEQSFYFTLNFDNKNNLIEVFVNASSTSPEINTYVQALARLISNQLKYSIPLSTIIKHLDGMDSGESYIVKFPGYPKSKFIKSIPDLLAKVLYFYGENKSSFNNQEFFPKEAPPKEENMEKKEKSTSKNSLVCSACGSDNVSVSEGCFTCMSCGYSKCS